MSRYIDADKLHDEIYELTKFKRDPVTGDAVMRLSMKISEVLRRIDEQPTADVVEIVRCKDCKYYKEYISLRGSAMMCFCPCSIGGQGKKKADDYCSYGERKEQEHE